MFVGLLFGLSILFLVLYFGDVFSEKRALVVRTKFLTETYAPGSEIRKDSGIFDFHNPDKRFKRFFSFPVTPSLALVFSSMILWLAGSLFVFFGMKIDPVMKFVLSFIFFVLVYRYMGIAAKKSRTGKIRRELAGAMDLMVVCLEAGLGLNSAFLRVANEMGDSPLGEELRQVNNEASAGIPIETALKNLAIRNGISDLNVIVAAIIQAQKLGTPLAETFRVQSESLREKIRMRIKEQIAKIPIKILFPLVLFIFPALFVIILGPAVIKIFETLSGP